MLRLSMVSAWTKIKRLYSQTYLAISTHPKCLYWQKENFNPVQLWQADFTMDFYYRQYWCSRYQHSKTLSWMAFPLLPLVLDKKQNDHKNLFLITSYSHWFWWEIFAFWIITTVVRRSVRRLPAPTTRGLKPILQHTGWNNDYSLNIR